jgi:hypothetical protein
MLHRRAVLLGGIAVTDATAGPPTSGEDGLTWAR